ncbi:hypothetical protein MYCTH_98318 [Thermothelomyces thermophilus ATCC 42464]|uniref:non-specific serine/threonine protein kinase n=1 Tax=Thermothelomyces thermophilus (strain ATCC 42464 / BCRC 31852 / DSM 1799) TaxID=573729 RepID=G2Q0N4_THET4|nr:uncharacterized protein MYCTH_98318 [Thermothelomyces thermophilus ATCC 42464]AEO54896.1 hypothetical protein MYCTH_98318 [Thermothelomyces thermophilus ATCC 42464]
MDHQNTPRRSAPRQPLGDATQRLNHATVAHLNRRYEVGDVENHIATKSMNATRGCSNPVLTIKDSSAEQRTHYPPAPAALADLGSANSRPAVRNPTSQDASNARRVSQFSNVSSNASSTRQLKTHIGPWQLGKTLGKGSSARVRLARHRVCHQLVAIKIVAKSTAHMTQAGSLANLDSIDYRKPTTSTDGGLRRMPLAIEREVAILKLIRHPNIIELLDIWENRSEIYLVTEYVEKGDLFEFINWNGPLHEEEAIFYFRQIMTALDYCHSFNICHRDLKPENILLKANGQIKIADFGMAALQQNPNHQLRTACGSPHYAAPELLRHQFYKGSAVDIWSMGVILYAMLAGRLPFDDDDMEVMMMKAKRAEYRMPPHLTREAKDLIRRILVDQPAHRITMKQMWRHALIKTYDYLDAYQNWDGQSQIALPNLGNLPVPEEIDVQILRQLKALWHTYSESALSERLRQKKPNDQKLFYWLLYNHREAQLENYNNNVPISKSDFHHLKPPNWGKRISTCEFTKSGRKGQTRTVSRFTVISNVPDIDDAGTIRSYDPYNASRILKPCDSQVSHAKIVIHRNNPEPGVSPSPTTVSHSYRSYRSANGSSRQRSGTNPRRTSTACQLRSAQTSMGSIRSHQSNPRVRANNRSKRTVDFSSIRNRSQHHRRNRRTTLAAPASSGGSNTTYDREPLSPSGHTKKPSAHQVSVTQSMVDVGHRAEDSFIWSKELEQLGHRIARDCDEAFRSSLLLSEPRKVETGSLEASPFMLPLRSSPVVQDRSVSSPAPYPWDNRPLPPLPSKDTITPLSIRKDNDSASLAAKTSKLQPNLDVLIPDRRVVSEPAYDRPSKDAGPLPSIRENTSDNWMRQNGGRHNFALTPLGTPIYAKNKGLDFLARPENTIRVVNSPSANGAAYLVDIPEPLNVRKISQKNNNARPTETSSLHDRQRPSFCGSEQKGQSTEGNRNDSTASKKRVSSWFRRAPKEAASGRTIETTSDSSVRSKETLVASEPSNLSRPTSQYTDGPSLRRPNKKKSFGLAFWKGAKEEMKMSIADSDPEEVQLHNEKKKRKRRSSKEPRVLSGTAYSFWSGSDSGIRKIEVQQNWLARLFRVKPAMRYLCFNILKRRARQEVAILLREWHLNLKEVSFAVELMTVIEHGKRNQLSIARFTQEKGAASSFHRVVDAINAAFGTRALLVTDKRKVSMMIKTLNS